MDSRVAEYDPTADYDDGSCSLVLLGCMSSKASNFRHLATLDDGSCEYVGCLDSLDANYDPTATLPGVCIAVVVGCTDPHAANFYPDANRELNEFSGEVASCAYLGCTDSSRSNFDPSATVDDGACAAIYPGCTVRANECPGTPTPGLLAARAPPLPGKRILPSAPAPSTLSRRTGPRRAQL